MRKNLLLFLILSLLLCGCSPSTVDNTTNESTLSSNTAQTDPDPTSASLPNDSQPLYSQQPMVSICMPLVTEQTLLDDATVYYYTYQDIYLTVQDQQVADSIIIDYLNRLDHVHSFSQELSNQAANVYSNGSTWTPHFMEYIYSPTRIDMNVLSLFGRNVVYSGGQHAEKEGIAANYNMITGEVLTLGSILHDADVIDQLRTLAIEAASEVEDTLSLFEDYSDVITQRFSRESSYDEDWYFTSEGLAFFFAPYEIASYTAGIVTIEIPYEKLTGIITDEFFPAETDASEGTVIATTLSEVEIDNFTQITELSINSAGEYIFLYCDGFVRNIQIETGTWNESGTNFLPNCTILALNTLSPGDGISLQAQIPDTQPTLRLSYDTGNEHIVQYISQSGIDGSILLIGN